MSWSDPESTRRNHAMRPLGAEGAEAAGGCRLHLVGGDTARGWRMEYALVAGCYSSNSPSGSAKARWGDKRKLILSPTCLQTGSPPGMHDSPVPRKKALC